MLIPAYSYPGYYAVNAGLNFLCGTNRISSISTPGQVPFVFCETFLLLLHSVLLVLSGG